MSGPAKPTNAKSASVKVEVTPKPGQPDPAGERLALQIAALGVAGVAQVRTGALYELSGRLSLSQAQAAAAQLLADPVTQQFALVNGAALSRDGLGAHWRVEVWMKDGKAEPAQACFKKAFADLGLPEPEGVRLGTVYKLVGRLTQAQAERVAGKLLASPGLHAVTVDPC